MSTTGLQIARLQHGAERPVLLGRVLPECWPDEVVTAIRALTCDRKEDYVDPEVAQHSERWINEWVATTTEGLPADARLLLLQDPWLRPANLAAMLPGCTGIPRLELAITPIFADVDIPRQIELALARPSACPERCALLYVPVEGAEAITDHAMRVVLAVARAAGVDVEESTDTSVISRFLIHAACPGRTHVMIAHSPRLATLAVGRRIVSIESLRAPPSLSPPAELDLAVCRSAAFRPHLPEHTHTILSTGSRWTVEVAEIQCELWTDTWRSRWDARSYWECGFSYGEALIQAKAAQRHFGDLGEDLVTEFWSIGSQTC